MSILGQKEEDGGCGDEMRVGGGVDEEGKRAISSKEVMATAVID